MHSPLAVSIQRVRAAADAGLRAAMGRVGECSIAEPAGAGSRAGYEPVDSRGSTWSEVIDATAWFRVGAGRVVDSDGRFFESLGSFVVVPCRSLGSFVVVL